MSTPTKMALIDHSKKIGEPGQYRLLNPADDIDQTLAKARNLGLEIRWYWEGFRTSGGEQVPFKIIRTEIPPGVIQGEHHHLTSHEVSVVESGEIYFVDNTSGQTLTREQILAQGTLVRSGGAITEEPGLNHTVANLLDDRAVFTTYQVIRTEQEFRPDRITAGHQK